MSLRPSLILKKPDSARIDEIRAMAERIVHSIDQGGDPKEDIATIRELTGRDYDFEYFRTLYSHSSIEEFAEEASLPVPRKVPDITKDELIEIIRLAKEYRMPDMTYYCQLFDANVPLPGASNLLFYPKDSKDGQDIGDYDPTPEEIVEQALDPDNIIRL